MDAQLKAKWVEALRSGDYPQGKISLLANGKYCCLEVLAEIAGYGTDSDIAYPKFPLTTPEIHRLEAMNDSEDKTFSEIADYIEANIPADEDPNTLGAALSRARKALADRSNLS